MDKIIDNIISTIFQNVSFSKEPRGLYDPLRYIMALGGKRLRPKLCLLTYALLRQEGKEDIFPQHIIEPSIGLEVFHNFTLIHDDIMDKSTLRRGKETIWKKWDEETAILSGDVMCIDSYRRIAMAPQECLHKVLNLFSITTTQICEGQQLDKDFESLGIVTMEEYMNMIGLKTAVLIACSAKMGAIIAGATDEVCAKMYEYGYNLGLAFQIADDYLDNYGNSSVFGKPIGGDIVHNKKSWLTTFAMQVADKEHKKMLQEAMNMPISTEQEIYNKIQLFNNIYSKLDVKNKACLEIENYTNKAIAALQGIVDKNVNLQLTNFAYSLIGRNI